MAAFLFRVVSCLRRLVTRVLPGVGDVAGGCCQALRLLGSIFWHSCRAFAVREVDFSGKQAEIRLKVAKNQKKSRFDEKKTPKVLQLWKNALSLHSQSDDKADANIGIWCNGNTTDSGPVILGSSPSIPTRRLPTEAFFVCLYIRQCMAAQGAACRRGG